MWSLYALQRRSLFLAKALKSNAWEFFLCVCAVYGSCDADADVDVVVECDNK